MRSKISLLNLIEAGIISPGTILYWPRRGGVTHRAKVLVTGDIEVKSGKTFETPSGAASHFYKHRPVDGWLVWRIGKKSGPRLDEVRKNLQSAQ